MTLVRNLCIIYSCLHDITFVVPGPVLIEVFSVDNTSLNVTWSPPVSPNGVILSYSILIVNINNNRNVRQESEISTSTLSFTESALGDGLY